MNIASDIASDIAAWAAQQGIIASYLAPAEAHQPRPDPVCGAPLTSGETATILQEAGVTDVVAAADSVIVYHPKRLLKRDQLRLPAQLGGVSIEYRKSSGPIHIDEKVAEMSAGVAPALQHHGAFCCGCSIGVGPIPGAGTLGALVQDADGTLFGLTNNHVIGGCNHMAVGLPVVAPGPIDMREHQMDPFCAGHHSTSIPLAFGIPGLVDHRSNQDAALFQLSNPGLVTSMQRGRYDTPTTTAPITAGMRVQKAGRTTGVTHGLVIGQAVTATPVAYAISQVSFSGRAFFEPVFLAQGEGALPFAERGDSGALVVCDRPDGTSASVGLVFAVAGDLTYILPIEPILHQLGVQLVGGHNI